MREEVVVLLRMLHRQQNSFRGFHGWLPVFG